MENKFDPFYNKEPTPPGASMVPLAVFGITEMNSIILFLFIPHALFHRGLFGVVRVHKKLIISWTQIM